jgi:hypothetical protein
MDSSANPSTPRMKTLVYGLQPLAVDVGVNLGGGNVRVA